MQFERSLFNIVLELSSKPEIKIDNIDFDLKIFSQSYSRIVNNVIKVGSRTSKGILRARALRHVYRHAFITIRHACLYPLNSYSGLTAHELIKFLIVSTVNCLNG